MNPDTLFTRLLLKQKHTEIRNAFPEIRNVVKCAGVTSTMRGQWFVQIVTPSLPMFNFDCRASNATEARYKAWSAFMRKYGPKAADHHLQFVKDGKAPAKLAAVETP